jgi:hypothetical protein
MSSYVSGATPQLGGPLSKWSFITLNERLTKWAFDSEHPEMGNGLNLESVLAHELSHLKGEWHSQIVNGIERTQSELACS